MKRISLILTCLLLSMAAFAQNIVVKGTVTDASTGETIPFASVSLKGTMTGTSTDVDGTYALTVPANGVLIFSFVGYVNLEVAVEGKAVVNAALSPSQEYLEETIVVAYGTSTKSSFTGSAAMVKSEAIEKKITTNVTSALAGTTPGVQVISSTGDPTAGGPSITIRGIGSMNASSSPLIIVDGAPYEGSIKDINSNDVESMSVLKDASASAIYGHRGANGVILITTKKGSGDAKIKFDARFGSNSRLIPNYDVITEPGQYYELFYQRLYNRYLYSGHSAAESYSYADRVLFDSNEGLGYQVFTVPDGEKLIGTNFKLNPNAKLGYSDGEYYYLPDDWYKEVYHNSFRQEYNMSVSGSGERFHYYASGGFVDDGGIISNSEYKRYTGRINADYQVKKWFKLTSSMSFSHADSKSKSNESWGSSGNVFYTVNNMAPIYPLYVRNADGTIMKNNGYTVYDSSGNTNFIRAAHVGNAVRDNEYDLNNWYSDVFIGNAGAVFTPIRGLSLTANLGVTSDNTRQNSLSSIYGGGSGATDGAATVQHSRMFAINQQYLAEYKTNFGGSEHNIDILAGYEQYNRKSQGLWGYNTKLFNPMVAELDNADGKLDLQAGSSTNYYMTEGFLSRAQYDYAGKYFVSASFRRDASSRFAPGHQWGNFWSAGGAWLISQEDFMRNVSFVDMLKLKVSYGQQGNDGLSNAYAWADQYGHTYNEDNKEYSISLQYKGNSDLTWETSKSFNVGLDFELFHGILNGTVEYFARKTEDLLYSKNVPLSAGNPTGVVPVNVGDIMNRGFEVSLDGNIIRTKNVNWNWNINLSHYKNTILSLDESVSEKGIRGSNRIIEVGGSLYDAFMYKYAGVDPITGQALYWQHIEEKDDDGNIISERDEKTTVFSDATQYKLGSILPKLYGGFGMTLNAYGFDLSAQCSFQLGGKFYDGSYQQLMWTQDQKGQAWHKDALKAWTPENPNTDVPRLDGDTQVGQSALDRFLISSNYLSINNVTLGYTFPAKWTNKIAISALRLYVAGENLAVFAARKGMDPRTSMGIGGMTSGAGITSSRYAPVRNITAGITLTF